MLDNVTSLTLGTALTALSQQQRVTADNISNLETPGYQAQRVSFQDSLRAAVAAGNPTSTQISTAASGDAPGVNGNNVNLDSEMVIAEKNSQQFQLISEATSNTFDLISDVLK